MTELKRAVELFNCLKTASDGIYEAFGCNGKGKIGLAIAGAQDQTIRLICDMLSVSGEEREKAVDILFDDLSTDEICKKLEEIKK
ncbi:MAG: hypothetical protein K6F77_01025 [Lachnospiraceae bacterium]|nr:hypothetical protein [Lachnospiraceae bacterium]